MSFTASNAAVFGTSAGVSITPTLSNVQLGSATVRYDVSTNVVGKEFVAPFVVEMLADASGKINVLEQNTVQITGIDAVFDIVASEEQAKALIGAFKVQEVNGTAATAWYAGQDVSANIDVTMQNDEAFKAALAALLADDAQIKANYSGVAADADMDSIRLYLKDEAHKDIVDILNYTGLANLLEASDLQQFDIALDASGGANNMYNALNTASALLRRVMFTQLPKDNVHAYSLPSNGADNANEDVSEMNFLPFLKGDKLSFVFDCKVGKLEGSAINSGAVIKTSEDASTTSATTESVSLIPSTEPAGGIIIGSSTATNNTYNIGTLNMTTPTVRRVALRIQLHEGAAAFATSIVDGVQNLS